ncbi:MAG: hypothetical protein HY698_15100 [Deltaproteobacteria bacterium]|nr:hypothetical protein [Deltaproteobacteria bacterium]
MSLLVPVLVTVTVTMTVAVVMAHSPVAVRRAPTWSPLVVVSVDHHAAPAHKNGDNETRVGKYPKSSHGPSSSMIPQAQSDCPPAHGFPPHFS